MAGCWLCGGLESEEVKRCNLDGGVTLDDFKITDSHYGRTARLVRCQQCGFRYADPLPDSDLVGMYAELSDPDYEQGREARIEPLRRIVKNCLQLNPQAKTLLDIGASTGLLCRAAMDCGLNAVGVEPSKWAVDIARTCQHVEVLEGIFPHPALAGRKFDLVTLCDVIEHVSNPMDLLRAIRRALVPSGIFVVVTPDVESIAAQWLGSRWWHYRVAHVGYFSRHTMHAALECGGFHVLHTSTYSWYFPVGYLTERVERYLPTRWLRQGIAQFSWGRRLFNICVPLNLYDSRVYYSKPRSGDERPLQGNAAV